MVNLHSLTPIGRFAYWSYKCSFYFACYFYWSNWNQRIRKVFLPPYSWVQSEFRVNMQFVNERILLLMEEIIIHPFLRIITGMCFVAHLSDIIDGNGNRQNRVKFIDPVFFVFDQFHWMAVKMSNVILGIHSCIRSSTSRDLSFPLKA